MSVCTWDNCFRQTKEVHGEELRNYLRIVTIGWAFGATFFGAVGGTALPELAKALGAPQFFFGLLGAAPFLGLVPQLPVSWLIERSGKRKWLFITTCTAHRLLFLLIALIPFVVPTSWESVRLWALIITLFLSWILAGFAGPTWNGWMGDMIPARIRGRYWAFRRRVGLLTQMAAALVAGWFIDWCSHRSIGTQGGISIVFAVAALLGSVDVLMFMFIPEIPKRIAKVRMSWGQLIAEPLKDRSFRQLMTYWFLLNVANAGMIGTFFQRNLREIVEMDNRWVNAVLVVMPCIGWYMAVKWWGRARDRWGNKPILVVASAAVVVNPLIWCLIGPEWKFLGLLVPIYGGFVWAGIDMALCNALLAFSGGNRVSSFPALASIISGTGGIVGPLAAGVLGQALGSGYVDIGPVHMASYHVLFVLGAILQAVTVILALRIEEPTAAPTREVLRVLYENATATARMLGYMPRRVATFPLVAPSAEDNEKNKAARRAGVPGKPGVVYHGIGKTCARQWSGRTNGIHNGVYPSSYNDYLQQLVSQAGIEIAEHAREREAAIRDDAKKEQLKI